ncbi:MAG: MarR family transcriptional regulator [Ignavibacteria bacterium]|jgi:DNA-binding MarR family transcriptional regulator|nr:MarR family transcriptional regulator [Ignavibacteria bacterium]
MEQLKKKPIPSDFNPPLKDRSRQAQAMADLTFDLVKEYTNMELDFAERNGLTPAEFKLLCYFRNAEAVSIKDLVREMKLTPGRITHIITSLEAKKLITRSINPDDRRGINVFLTGKSQPLIKDLNAKCLDMHSCVLAKYEAADTECVSGIIRELIERMRGRN